MNTPYNIYFQIDSNYYLGSQIRASNKKIELFYHYVTARNKKVDFEHLDTGQISSGYLPDHVSFHFDGQIHTKAKDSRKRKQYLSELKCEINPFNLERNNFTPIFLESINISDSQLIQNRFKLVERSETVNKPLIDLTGLNSFSLILFSKCERTNPNAILENEHIRKLNSIVGVQIKDVFSVDDKAQKFKNTSGFSTEIIVLAVQNIWEEFSKIEHHITGEIGKQGGNSVITPPIELLGRMVNLNKNR